jgi:hypothetical protein
MATKQQVVDQFINPLQPFKNIGYATGISKPPPGPTTIETFAQPMNYVGAPTASVDINDPETRAQLEFYAALSGMSLQEYLDAQAAAGPVKQAPTINNEYLRGVGDRQGNDTTSAGAIAQAQNTYTTDSNTLNAANRKAQEDYFANTVTPALGAQQSAVANQQTANRLAESQLRSGGTTLNNALNATQAQRTQGISGANAAQTQALNSLTGQLNASNSAATAASSRLGTQLSQANTAQNNALTSFGNSVANSNQLQTQQANLLGQAMAAYNDQGAEAADVFQFRMNELNNEDRAALASYVAKTNPMLAEQIARGSSDKYVQQQQDVYNKYKELSDPQITAQERFIAELARRQTEASDKSSRDAAYQAMKQRGSTSAGTQIAAQLANRQATAQDRVLAELGLSASAQQRAMGALQGQGTVAEQLRNADDKMRNFQDQYAQNDAVRRYQVAQGQQNSALASTAQQGNRQAQVFDANRATINDATNRSGMTFDAQNQSINANSARDADYFDANTATNNANSGRNVQAFDASRSVINDNSGRNVAGYNAATGTNEANFARDQYGWNSADTNANTAYGTTRDQVATSIGNRAAEVGSASGLTGSAIGASGQYTNMQNGLTRAQQDALDRLLDNTIVSNTTRPKATNV